MVTVRVTQMITMASPNLFQAALLLPLWFGLACSADFIVNECFNPITPDTQGSITITCPEDFVISMDDAFFGLNKWGACTLTEDDCTEQTKTFHVCDGQQNCTRTFKTFTRTCGYSSMLVIGYSCIRALKDPTMAPPATPQFVAEQSSPIYNGRPRMNPPSVPKQPQTQSSSKDKEEIGLIIGCALASFITVVFLIIAIVMVIRRLLEKDEKDGRDNSPRHAGNCGSVCIKIDCLPCFGKAETPSKNSHDLRMRKKTAAEAAQLDLEEYKLRVAPIGAESIADQDCALSAEHNSSSSSSSLNSDETAPPPSHHYHGKKVPATVHLQKQQILPGGTSQHKVSNAKGMSKRDKMKKHPSTYDHDNENTLPFSSNRNLVLLENDISPTLDNIPENSSNSSQPKFDAIALPNTQTLSSC